MQERLQKDLQSERKKRADAEVLRKRAESNLRHLQLQNPSLSLEAMQHLLDAQDQVGPKHAGSSHTPVRRHLCNAPAGLCQCVVGACRLPALVRNNGAAANCRVGTP